MKRMTIKPPEGLTSVGSKYGLIAENDDLSNVDIFTVIDRLGEYEDTGMEPDEIMDGKILKGWIPVNERLPNSEIPVYATVEYHGGSRRVQEAFWRDGDFVDLHGYSLSEIIKAWKPRHIPMPYKPEIGGGK